MANWSNIILKDIAEFNPRESIKKGEIATKIGMDKLQPFCRDIAEIEHAKFSGGTKFRNGDTLMARITPCLENGKTAMVNVLNDNEVGFGSTEYIVFRAKKGKTDPHFLYYLVCSPTVREPAIKSMVGSSGRQRVQTDVVQNMELLVPCIEEQRVIGDFLKKIDDKITLNNKINRNLEEQAKRIFIKELVEIDELPEGWKEGSLLDIADYLNGLAMQKFRPKENEVGLSVLKIKDLRQGSCDASDEYCSPSIKEDYIVKDGDVIFSWSGSLLVDLWCGGECGLNQHLFKVTSEVYDKWFYYSWTQYHLDRFIAIAASKATTMGHIKRSELSKAEVYIPSKNDYERFSEILKPMYDVIINNRVENRKLSSIRDELLPKLMSGSIDVAELKI